MCFKLEAKYKYEGEINLRAIVAIGQKGLLLRLLNDEIKRV
jgi:hypothetical protein